MIAHVPTVLPPSTRERGLLRLPTFVAPLPNDVVASSLWLDKTVLVTGAAGTVGQEIMSQLARLPVQSVVAIDNDERATFFLEHRLQHLRHFNFVLADVCDLQSLSALMEGVDVVIHAAALKHVGLCERAPRAAIQTNIIGTQHVIQAALEAGVERFLLTSSDKAVNPTNVMGTSKLMAERLVTAANVQSRNGRTVLASCRFGNVLGSSGSVIQVFKEQIAGGGPVTLTHPDMTRFIMTLSQAVSLVMDAVFLAKGGEVFVTKMSVCRIEDLAQVMIEELAPQHGYKPREIPIKLIGPKPGEKFYEELINDEEVRRVLELDRHFVVVPALRSQRHPIDYDYPSALGQQTIQPYNSANVVPMPRDALRQFLRENDFLGREPLPCA
jgi:FlaA1/EpsC-like NDP-sugar epimerase